MGFDTKRQMLRNAHFYMKGGEPTFAALCIEVCCADQDEAALAAIGARFWCCALTLAECIW
jgi:hypothetical protein